MKTRNFIYLGLITNTIRNRALDLRSWLSRLLRNIGIGRFAFRVRMFFFKLDNLLGRYNQRVIEYPWVLRKLGSGKGRRLLDVGCAGSLLDHELIARGFNVVGLDIQDHVMRNFRETFVKANVLNIDFPYETFDVILLVSTIEHVGLDTYSQNLLAEKGDLQAMQKLQKLLKPKGILVLTTPYEGKGPLRIHKFGARGEFLEHRYDCERLAKLLVGYEIVDSTFFLCLLRNQCKFVPIEKAILDKLPSNVCEGSLACLILKKKAP